jgi:enterochelin esterase-like enzyme
MLSDQYARFLLEEMLPEVAKQYKLTDTAAGRAIGGISSGGICAFTVAWQRPDALSKVLSHVGSFTNIRGGHVYPALIRKTKPAKPIRVFLQDGANDLDNEHGNWPLANQEMAAALKFAKYDYRFEFGTERQARRRHPTRLAPLAVARLCRAKHGAMSRERP